MRGARVAVDIAITEDLGCESVECVRARLASGTPVDACNSHGTTILIVAISHMNADLAAEWIARGASVSLRSTSPHERVTSLS